ncbi:Crp/Fnr family transcriptional regulator [Burkholderia ambifaria]|uniref:Crp/Fnr family transcriptional regulator n=1 Tax=Burkholderia ambifaria TaxID=152480 RepID=UPI00158B30E4|nr:Crp/Fnr family transcriptional regulator [Burkholderia ambifaria]UEP39528.1 Crp/Fnr family transcriptional regulator [Burkholderia ambifaria]
MLALQSDLHGNHLLSALPYDEWQALAPHLELVRLRAEQLLYDSGQRIHHVYFPTTAVISILYMMENGGSVEVAAVGREGMTGVPVLTGGEAMPNRVQVQYAGFAYRMSAQALRLHFARSERMQRLMLLYMHALLTQIAQMAACNRHHSLNKQLCRWLLIEVDRVDSYELAVTQQLISEMLGVRREGVTEAAGKLHREGLILHRRGHIRVLDRNGLEANACECYGLVKREFDRLLPHRHRAALPDAGTVGRAEGEAVCSRTPLPSPSV